LSTTSRSRTVPASSGSSSSCTREFDGSRIRSGLLYRVQPGDALTETAPQYPDQDFMIVDTVVDEPNVANYLFREQEGSFLMGVLAGRLTETDGVLRGGGIDRSRLDDRWVRRRRRQPGHPPVPSRLRGRRRLRVRQCRRYHELRRQLRRPFGRAGRRPHCRCTKMGWISSITLRARRASACSRPHRRKAGSRSVSTRTSRSPTSRSRT